MMRKLSVKVNVLRELDAQYLARVVGGATEYPDCDTTQSGCGSSQCTSQFSCSGGCDSRGDPICHETIPRTPCESLSGC